jgi:GT2 family glycosyltransferase
MNSLWRRRLTRPVETARVLAPRLLPLGLRWRLAALVRPLRPPRATAPRPDEWQLEIGRELERPLAPAALAGPWPRVSVLIVTHDNAALTRLCLDSLAAWSAYPDLEVVVVDNASTDGTPALLRDRQRSDPALRVVLNLDNAGFAAACNRAAQEATGEILCFLNNDTVVTPGWLQPLVQALLAEPCLGMVGPLSNGVANEARVRGPYGSLAEMREWAEGYVRRRHGRSFPIPMLAFYCAALRRAVWEEVGPLDDRFGLGLFEDDDYARRLRRAGYRLVCREDSFVHHWQQASFDRLARARYLELYERNRRYLREKWRGEGRGSGTGTGTGTKRRRDG